jgi:predicted MPP superfamily phosphohydrolase
MIRSELVRVSMGEPTASDHTDPTHVRSPRRRRFLRRSLIGGAALLGGGALWSIFGERTWLTVRRVTVPVPALPLDLDGFTICHLSDLHRGPFVSEGEVRDSVEMAMRLKPDLIVLTGDYVSLKARYAESCASALSSLSAPHGVYGTLGNHEYWTRRVGAVTDALEHAGIMMLVNRSARITVGGTDWWLCGLDDAWAGMPDLDETLAGVPDEAFKILLCHEPDFADEAAGRGIPLQLSGHSHGGQVRLPRLGAIRLPYMAFKYPYGLQRVEGADMLVYTTAGVGVTVVPFRINCRPEVAFLTLERSVQQSDSGPPGAQYA